MKQFFPAMVFLVIVLFSLGGCQTPVPKPKPDRAETLAALTTMTRGLTNKNISEDDLKNLAHQVARDPQAQTAIKSINSAFSASHTVKYCPIDGQRFSGEMTDCPVHHVKLKWVE